MALVRPLAGILALTVATVGIVGAGGIGVALDTALNLFQWTQVAVILIAVFAIVVLAEVVVTQVRKRVL